MESSDVFERTEEWARSIRESLVANADAEAQVHAAEVDEEGLAPDGVQTPTKNRIQPQTHTPGLDLEDTPIVTPSRTRIVLKADSVAESADTLESHPTTIGTLETLESTFEKTLHARAMRAAGADLDSKVRPVKAVKTEKIPRAFLYGTGFGVSGTRHRESLQRSQEGTRHRRRWENDHLMNVPNAQLPLPSDWQVHPTHPVHHNLPYHVAQYWDRGLQRYVNETRAAAAVLRRSQIIAQQSGIPVDQAVPKKKSKKSKKHNAGSVISVATSEAGTDMSGVSEMSAFYVPASTIGQVTRQLRVAAKRTPAVKVWVRALEAPIRQYVVSESIRLSGDAASEMSGSVVTDFSDNGAAVGDEHFTESDSEDEVVFVGRRVAPVEAVAETKAETETSTDDDDAASDTTISPAADGILFDDLGDGERGSFKRWLAHSLSDYYGLTSTSSTMDSDVPGKPGNRVVYMTVRDELKRADAGPILVPRPMWEVFDM